MGQRRNLVASLTLSCGQLYQRKYCMPWALHLILTWMCHYLKHCPWSPNRSAHSRISSKIKKHDKECTFDVISIWSRTWRKASARCSPECHPGTWWNAIKSARSFRIYCGPSAVWMVVVSIQCTVTAINDERFGSLHKSVVKDISQDIAKNKQSNNEHKIPVKIYLHLILQYVEMLIPNFHDSLANCGVVGNVGVLELLPQHQKNGL